CASAVPFLCTCHADPKTPQAWLQRAWHEMVHKYLKYNSTVENIILLIITAHYVFLILLSNKQYGEGVEVPGDPIVPINII
ncbi:hypothetical protein ACO1NA_14600, partial [Staphylococcus aureus]